MFEIHRDSGRLNPVAEHEVSHGLIALVLHPSGRFVYGVGGVHGSVTALSVSRDSCSDLDAAATGGSLPVSVAIDPTGRYLLTAHDSGDLVVQHLRDDGTIGSVSSVVRHKSNGTGPVPHRQDGSHLHQVRFDERSDNILITDLGADMIYTYRLDMGTGRLTAAAQADAPPGSGPRHLAIHGSGLVVVADELSATVSWYRLFRNSGRLNWLGRVAASPGDAGVTNYPSEIILSADGHRAFVANRGPDTIAAFRLSARGLTAEGEVTAGSSWPEHFLLIDSRVYCACKQRNQVTLLEVSADGRLGCGEVVASVLSPRWIGACS